MRRPIRRREVPNVDLGAGFDPLLARIFAARGVRGLDEVQDYTLQHLARVSTLEAVEAAASLIADHIARQSEILVVGDYDADGPSKCVKLHGSASRGTTMRKEASI